MKAYLVVTSSGVTTFSNPPDSICVLVAQFKESVHPQHPMKNKAILWDIHPEYFDKVIATKIDEKKWEPSTEISTVVMEYLNQSFSKSARDYPS